MTLSSHDLEVFLRPRRWDDGAVKCAVLLGNQAVPFGAVREQSGLTVKVTEHYPYYGQVTEIVTPALR